MTGDRISLLGLRAFGRHGVLDHERRDGQEFVVDAVLWLDTRPAAAADDLSLTVDYGAVAGQAGGGRLRRAGRADRDAGRPPGRGVPVRPRGRARGRDHRAQAAGAAGPVVRRRDRDHPPEPGMTRRIPGRRSCSPWAATSATGWPTCRRGVDALCAGPGLVRRRGLAGLRDRAGRRPGPAGLPERRARRRRRRCRARAVLDRCQAAEDALGRVRGPRLGAAHPRRRRHRLRRRDQRRPASSRCRIRARTSGPSCWLPGTTSIPAR